MGTLPEVTKVRIPVEKICLRYPVISPKSDSLNQQGVHHGKHQRPRTTLPLE